MPSSVAFSETVFLSSTCTSKALSFSFSFFLCTTVSKMSTLVQVPSSGCSPSVTLFSSFFFSKNKSSFRCFFVAFAVDLHLPYHFLIYLLCLSNINHYVVRCIKHVLGVNLLVIKQKITATSCKSLSSRT